MSDKKHIDRLFQEGFKDFEAVPNDVVWENIEAKLNEKKKKRRVIPIWWRYAGVAALLALLLTAGGIFFNNADDNATDQVVDIETKTPENTKSNKNSHSINNTAETPVIASDINTNNKSNNTTEASIETDNNTHSENASNNIAITQNAGSKTKKPSNKVNPNPLYNKSKTASTNNNASIANTTLKEKRKSSNLQNSSKNTVNVANISEENNVDVKLENETHLVTKYKDKLEITEALEKQTTIASSNKKATTNDTKSDTKSVLDSEENKRSIEDALEQTEEIAETEETPSNRWRVAPNAAPVYFNTLNEGSSIGPQFNNNSKSGEINMSYGVSASYAVNKKLRVRSGINRVNLGYNINDVVIFQSVGLSSRSSALQNVNSNSGNADVVSIISSESLNTNFNDSFASSNGSINQALGFIEIPLEIQYTLSDKKFGINLIGGFSSFFLNNNEIFSEEQNGTRTYFEANNINNTSYSANLGMGLNYKITKTFDLNLEPIFKYQFNTFNNTSGNFSPFFIGVYTGFSIKF